MDSCLRRNDPIRVDPRPRHSGTGCTLSNGAGTPHHIALPKKCEGRRKTKDARPKARGKGGMNIQYRTRNIE